MTLKKHQLEEEIKDLKKQRKEEVMVNILWDDLCVAGIKKSFHVGLASVQLASQPSVNLLSGGWNGGMMESVFLIVDKEVYHALL